MSAIGSNARRTTLLRLIRSEACNAVACKALAQVFQDYDDSLAAIFRKMAASERRHAVILGWYYRIRFGPLPSANDTFKTNHKTLHLVLNAGLRRVLKEKLAEKRRQQWHHFWRKNANSETS